MELIKELLIYSKKEGVKNPRPAVPPQPGPTPLVPSASLEDVDIGALIKEHMIEFC